MDTVISVPYGHPELRQIQNRNLFQGISIAVIIHLLLVGAYWGSQLVRREQEFRGPVKILKYSEIGPPPSINQANLAPPVAIEAPAVKPNVGVPVPVPDAMVNPEQTIATQEEMSKDASQGLEGVGSGEVKIEGDIQVEPEDEFKFVAYEQDPVPVKTVTPEYPSIARQAGIEGMVQVQVLVGTDGKVKKARVVKSDNPIFEPNALKAAMEWVFTPALQQKKPVEVPVVIPFRFSLKD